jgi:hypothetical protein
MPGIIATRNHQYPAANPACRPRWQYSLQDRNPKQERSLECVPRRVNRRIDSADGYLTEGAWLDLRAD